MAFINTHKREELQIEYEKITAPGRGLLAKLARGALKVVKPVIPQLDLDVVDRSLANIRRDRALQRAAYEWIDPRSSWDLATLTNFQETLGLKKLTRERFSERVMHYCRVLKQKVPTLERHIDARIAELEFAYLGDRTQAEYFGELELFQREAIANAIRVATGQSDALTKLSDAMQLLLPAIAGVFRYVLDPQHDVDNVNTNANYMTIARLKRKARVPDIPELLCEYGETPAARTAFELWKDLDRRAKQIFVITADSDENSRIGFWVPDVVEDNRMIPGAPAAYHLRAPQPIFVDDPPELPIGPDITKRKWETYLTDKSEEGFRDAMFISIPILARARRDLDLVVVGIVNVNCGADRSWPRAYSSAWLRFAAKQASPLLHLAWHISVLNHVGRERDLGLFERNPFVYQLPSAGPLALPPEGHDEGV